MLVACVAWIFGTVAMRILAQVKDKDGPTVIFTWEDVLASAELNLTP